MPQRLVRQLAHVCIFTQDLEATEAFYRDALGIPVLFRFLKEGRTVGFYLDVGGRSHVEVFEKPDTGFDERNAINHLCLEVESMDATLAHLEAAGIPVTDRSYGCDDSWQAWITDPNGVRIELFEYTDRSAQFVGGDRVVTW